MSINNREILTSVWVAIAMTLLFPPFLFEYPGGGRASAGFGFLFLPPKRGSLSGFVDVPLLLMEWIAIVIFAVIAWKLWCSPEKKGLTETLLEMVRDYLKSRKELDLLEADARIQAMEANRKREQ